MRRLADADRIRAFMDAVGRAARTESRLYFTGGATAVLIGWRSSTIDVNILMVPEDDQVFRSLPELKESLELNIELASPAIDRRGAIDRESLMKHFEEIGPHLYRFPAVDPPAFRRAVERVCQVP